MKIENTVYEGAYFGRMLDQGLKEESRILDEIKGLIDNLERINQEYWDAIVLGHPIENAQQAGEYAKTIKMGNEGQVQINRQLTQINKDLGAMV